MAATTRARSRRPPLPTYAVVVVAAVAVAVATLKALAPENGSAGDGAGGRATVVRVVDGDTVVVGLGPVEERVRLIGIDTPESVARDRPNECFGAEASHHLARLLPPGTTVVLSRDVEPRDVYDRLLAYVQRASDGLFVNAAQVGDGFAVASDHPPNSTHRALFERAERAARAGGLGLWAACGGADVPLAAAGPGSPAGDRRVATSPH